MKTEFYELDKLVNVDKPQLILLGARPGMGKSTLALNIGTNIALHQNIPVLFFSLEENYLNSNMKELRNPRLFIKDKAPITIDEILLEIEEYVKNEGVKLVIIDYLQLIQYDKSKLMSRDNEITDIIKKLKEISKKLKITILVTSQISRDPDYRTDHRPILSDLRESEHTLKIIDTILLLYRDEYYNPDTEMKNIAEVYVEKNNNGNTGKIDLAFLPEFFKFANLALKMN